MNKHKIIILGCLIVIFCFGFVVKGYVKNNSDKVIVLRDYGIKTVQSQSYYVFYDNISDILSNSDLVISGDVVDVKEPQKVNIYIV